MKHELQIHTEAVSAQMAHFYEVCSLIITLLSPLEPQTSDKRLGLLKAQLPFTKSSSSPKVCLSVYLSSNLKFYIATSLYNIIQVMGSYGK